MSKIWHCCFVDKKPLAPWILTKCHRDQSKYLQKKHGVYPYKRKFFSRASGEINGKCHLWNQHLRLFASFLAKRNPESFSSFFIRYEAPQKLGQQSNVKTRMLFQAMVEVIWQEANLRRLSDKKKAMRKQKRGAVQCGAVFSNCGKM